mgnify:CR=1 FL=1
MLKIISSRISIICISLIVSYFISDVYENILGFILILSIGVVHGANDLLIINKYSKKETKRSEALYFFYYLTIVFLGFVFFYVFPSIALLTFVIVSIYHFGEQHWEVNLSKSDSVNLNKVFLFIFHGIIFFIIIFMNNLKIVNEVLSSFNINPLENYYLLLALIVFSVLYFLFLLYLKNLRKYLFQPITQDLFGSIRNTIEESFRNYIVGARLLKVGVFETGEYDAAGGNQLRVILSIQLTSDDLEIFDVEAKIK